MSTARKVAKNTTVLLTAQIISYIFTFFIAMYTARYLGVEGFGTLSIAFAFTGILGVFTDLGLGTLTIREVARNKSLKDKYVANTSVIKIILNSFTFGLIAIVVYIFGYPEEVKLVIYLITISLLINSFYSQFNAIFQAYEKMEIISITTILNSILVFSGVLIAIYLNKSIFIFAFIYIISSLFCLIFNLIIYTWKFKLPPLDIDLSFWKSTIKEAWPFALTGIFISIYFWIDSVMLSVIAGNEAVGLYNAAYKILMVLLFIPSVFIAALFPVMSKHFKSAQNLLKMEYEKAFKYLFITAVFIFVYGILFANEIIYSIFGNGYLPSILILQILMLVVPVIFLNSLLGNILSAINKQRFVSIVALLNAIFNIGLNIFLIPKYGYIGASIATVLTETSGFTIGFIYVNRYFFKISIREYMIKPLLGGFLFAFIMYYLKIVMPWVFAAALGLFAYLAILYLFKLINEDDKNLFKHILMGETIE